MQQVVLFAVLGLGAGAAYALTGLGVVVVFRGIEILQWTGDKFVTTSPGFITAPALQ